MAPWQKGQSGNPNGRPPGSAQKEYFEQLRIVSKELVEIIKTERKRRRGTVDGKRVMVDVDVETKRYTTTYMRRVAEVVFELALQGNMLAIEHIAQRFDGKVADSVDITSSSDVKVRLYESFIKTGRLRFVKIGARAVGVIEDELDVLIEELRRERDRSV